MALPSDRNTREFLSFTLDTNGNPALRIRPISGGVGSIADIKTLNDRWFQSFVEDSNGDPAFNVVFGGGGSGVPAAGSNTQVQFNDAGFLGGDADFTWNKTTNLLTVAGTVNATNFNGILGATTPAAVTGTTVTATGSFLAPNGSAAAPAYSFSGDTTAGMYLAGDLRFSVGGGLRLQLTTGLADFFVPVRSNASVTVATSANTVPLTVSGHSVTGSGTSSLASYSSTLNTSGVVHLNDWSVTDTASGSGSTALRIRGGAAGATAKFAVQLSDGSISKTGTFTFPGITFNNNDYLGVAAGGAFQLNNGTNSTWNLLTTNANQAFTSGGGAVAGVVGSYVPGSGSGSWAALHIVPTINGTSSGTAYGLLIASKTNTLTGGTIKLASFGTTTTDGFTGYTEVFSVSTSGALVTGSHITSGGRLRVAAGENIEWNGRAHMNSPADGIITLLNAAESDFTRLNFGGTTSSFPAITRSTIGARIVLADGTSGAYLSVGAAPATPLANSYFSEGVAFAGLGTPSNGTFVYCSDCTIANPCAGSGTGAIAKRLNGVWVCN